MMVQNSYSSRTPMKYFAYSTLESPTLEDRNKNQAQEEQFELKNRSVHFCTRLHLKGWIAFLINLRAKSSITGDFKRLSHQQLLSLLVIMCTNQIRIKNLTCMSCVYETAELNAAASAIPEKWC